MLTKGEQPLCRCSPDDRHEGRSLEVPAWMFDAAACVQLVGTPIVTCQALAELKVLLERADLELIGAVLEAF